METCPKYNRAMAPSFTDQKELEDLVSWLYKTTTDPVSKATYPDVIGRAFWVPFRLINVSTCCVTLDIYVLVILRWKVIG